MDKQHISIMYPGGFKPVHVGHIATIDSYLKGDPEHTTDVYVIISQKDRDGISAMSTLSFLTKIFSGFKNFHCMISSSKSPVQQVYNLTATKEFGDGLYAMGVSAKGDDAQKAIIYAKSFSTDGKYYTPGVKTLILIPDDIATYKTRKDDYDETPISSRVMRDDLLNDDYYGFLSAYDSPLLPDYVKKDDIEQYYNDLKQEIRLPLRETSSAGRINHPYDDNTLTFGEIKEMLASLFHGEIQDITEKLDGINILASVDLQGEVIFARNKKNMLTTPMYMDDILSNTSWAEETKKSFINGCNTIKKVFDNLKDKVKFFNYNDRLDKLRYRNWVSVEIIDHSNMNVIPYVDNFVSFHNKILSVCYDDNDGGRTSIFDNPNTEKDSYTLEQAIKSTDLKDNDFKASVTPRMIFKDNGQGNLMLQEHINDLSDLMEEYSLVDTDTIGYYKYVAMFKYIVNNVPIDIPREYMDLLAARWSGYKKININDFRNLGTKKTKEESQQINQMVKSIREYEKDHLIALQHRVMLPVDKFFINVGNDALKLFSGGTNDTHKDSTINKIKKNIADAISKIEETGNMSSLDKLEFLLFRLGDTVDINTSEGIVFKYHGRFFKITGSFAVLNQVINLSRKLK